MSDTKDQINRARWAELNLNGGVYIDDPEDRTNYLLDERERLGGGCDECSNNGALLAIMLDNAISGAEAFAETIGEPMFDDPEDESVWLACKEARDAFHAGTLTELRKRWEAEDAASAAKGGDRG